MMPEVSDFSIDRILKFEGIITDKIKMYEKQDQTVNNLHKISAKQFNVFSLIKSRKVMLKLFST